MTLHEALHLLNLEPDQCYSPSDIAQRLGYKDAHGLYRPLRTGDLKSETLGRGRWQIKGSVAAEWAMLTGRLRRMIKQREQATA